MDGEAISEKLSHCEEFYLFYWVKFDEPQLDADGDGPYHEAEIDSDYLNLLDEQE